MLEHFASLSVEANILENTNHSLESESASKSLQLQTYINQIQSLESKLMEKENIVDSQSSRIAAMTCKITALESEVKLMTDEKNILEQNITYLKSMYKQKQCESNIEITGVTEIDSELKLYENRIKSLGNIKAKMEIEREEMLEKIKTLERLLSNARREIVDLKLALQDATSETKSLQQQNDKLSRINMQHTTADNTLLEERIDELGRRNISHEVHMITSSKEELELPLLLEETIHEVSNEEDNDSIHYQGVYNKYSSFSHGSTL